MTTFYVHWVGLLIVVQILEEESPTEDEELGFLSYMKDEERRH